MAQWSSRQKISGVWVTVEPDIGNRLSFWNAVLDGTSQFGRDVHMEFEYGRNRDTLRGDLIRFFRGVSEQFVVVIDDAHELNDALVLEDLFAVLHACPNVVAVVATRSRTELETPRRELTLDITVIGPDEMVLTAEDVDRMVGEQISRYGTTAHLLEASGGNPLLLRAILGGSSRGARAQTATHSIVSDYLRHLLEKEGGGLALLAPLNSVPDDVDVPLASHLSGMAPGRVESLLDLLETDGLVMRRDALDGVRYRFHPLVREVLRSELRRDHPEQFRHASILASAAAEARQQFLPALRHAVDAEDYSRASDVCLHGGFALLRSGGAAGIIEQVPRRYVARLPFLAIVLGLAANARGERWKALQFLTLALGASRVGRNNQRVAEQVGLALVESTVLRITGRPADSVAPARRMLVLLDEAAPADLEEIADQVDSYRLQGALSLFRAGRLLESKMVAELVGVSAHSLRQRRPESLGAASLVAAVEAMRGDCRKAEAMLTRIDESDYPVELRDGYLGSLAHLARGVIALEGADPDAADHEIDLYRGRDNLEHGTLFSAAHSLTSLWRGAPEVALRELNERERADHPRARASHEDRRVNTAVRVLLRAAAGEIGPAHAALQGLDRADPVAKILRAQLFLIERRPDLVVEELGRPVVLESPRLQAAGEVLMVVASLANKDESVAEVAFRRFLAAAEVCGTLSPLVLVPYEQRAALWTFAELVGVDTELLTRFRAVPAPFRMTTTRAALTPRETEILEQLRRTARLSEIAALLHVSPNTVKTQVRTLYRKLGASTRDEALRAAYLQGLFEELDAPRSV
jgi:LuxR family maltose regulon positive regulatory protein